MAIIEATPEETAEVFGGGRIFFVPRYKKPPPPSTGQDPMAPAIQNLEEALLRLNKEANPEKDST